MRTPRYYRRRAEELRQKAETVDDPKLRDQLRVIAGEYEEMALTAEAIMRASAG